MKVFYNSPIVECVSEYIFLIWKKKKAWDKKQMKLKNKREHLWKIWRESWISPGCSHEFNVVFMQREKSQHLFATTYEVHTFKNNNKKIIKRQFCLLFSFLYLFICSCKFVIIETRTYDIAVDEKVMSCKAYIRGRSKSATDVL